MIKLSNGVELSEDTVVSALRKAGISAEPEQTQVKVYNFRATKKGDFGYPYYLGGVGSCTFEVAAKTGYNSTDAHITAYTKTEVEQIIAGLQGLLKS